MMSSTTGTRRNDLQGLNYRNLRKRNITSKILTTLSLIFTLIAVMPLFFVLVYVLIMGGSSLSLSLFTELPPAPGLEGGGVGNAIIGTFIITFIAALIAIPMGVGGGIYLAEYSRNSAFARFVRFGTNVLSGVPSIIAGVFIYALIVSTRLLFGASYSSIAGGLALSILMLPTVIKTTDEGLKLVPDDLRRAALGVGASKFSTILQITLPTAFTSVATGIMLAIARASGETAPLIFTSLFSPFWPNGLLSPIASLSVLIYNFSTMPYDVQVRLAWASSFIVVMLVLGLNLLSRLIVRYSNR